MKSNTNSKTRAATTAALVDRHRSLLDIKNPVPSSSSVNNDQFFQNKIVLSVSEFAVHMGISIRTVERMLKRGEIPYKRVGRRVVIPVTAIETWLNGKD